MNIVKELDLAIKLAEAKTVEGAYRSGNTDYDAYMTNAEWAAFEKDMKKNKLQPHAHTEYSAGGGDELTEKNGRPPKMASYASSSRLIYRLSREKAGFHYEQKLATTVGGTANLDGFYETDEHYIFVEAKCHEPYSAKQTSVSKSYEELYKFINAQMTDEIKINMTASKCGRYLNVDYIVGGERLAHFDLKQMICHLLGIATGILKGELEHKQVNFIYLLYDPSDLSLSDNVKAKIERIYAKTCDECNAIDFAALLRVILSFLRTEYYPNSMSDDEIASIVQKFTFTLASQDFYKILLEQDF